MGPGHYQPLGHHTVLPAMVKAVLWNSTMGRSWNQWASLWLVTSIRRFTQRRAVRKAAETGGAWFLSAACKVKKSACWSSVASTNSPNWPFRAPLQDRAPQLRAHPKSGIPFDHVGDNLKKSQPCKHATVYTLYIYIFCTSEAQKGSTKFRKLCESHL